MKRFIWVLLLVLFVTTGTASAQQVDANITFGWDLHEDAANVTGFRLYMSTTSGQYTYGAVNAVAIELGGTSTQTGPVPLILTTGTTYFFVLTAYNDYGESSPSNEVSHLVPDSLPPDAPYNVDVTLRQAQ